MTTKAPFVAWPGWQRLRVTGAMALGFFAFFYGVYGLADWLTSLHTSRLPLYLDIELQIPFVPAAAIIYASMNGLLILALFVLRDPKELRPLVFTLCAQTVIAAVFFIAIPVEMAFTHETPTGILGTIFAWADTANLDHNEFPSLHVSFAFTAAGALVPRAPQSRLVRSSLWLWASAIAVSTLLIHAHYIIDVVGGVALAWFSLVVMYPRFDRTATTS